MTRQEIIQLIQQHKIVAILRLDDPEQVGPIIDALAAGGIYVIEISMNTPDCLKQIEIHSQRDDVLLGVGTVTDAMMAKQAIDRGAKFVVTPISRKYIIETSHMWGAPVLSGAFTPAEAFEAWEWKAEMIKLFPAHAMGIEYFKALRAPFPQIPFIPTGGITPENLTAWLDAGAKALGVGSSLTDKYAIASGNYSKIIDQSKRFVDLVHEWNIQHP